MWKVFREKKFSAGMVQNLPMELDENIQDIVDEKEMEPYMLKK